MSGDGCGPNDSGVSRGAVIDAMLEAFEPFLDAIADKINARQMRGRERLINQTQSDLGPRRHRAAVKRRVENGEGGAFISPDGRKFLLTPEAVREELARGSRGSSPTAAPAPARDASPEQPAGKSRKRELSEFERELMSGLRAVK